MKWQPVEQTSLPGLISRGKVRDMYRLGDRLMIVATDRISAFDVVMPRPIPGKGILLTQMSRFWLSTLPACQPHHLEFVVEDRNVPEPYAGFADQLCGRAMVVKRVHILPVECIVRGYLAGSGWKEYQANGTICGVSLPADLRRAQKLPTPIFTPSTKATIGHDQNISFEQAGELVGRFLADRGAASRDGRELMEHVRRRSIEIYQQAARHAERCGIIIADTKFEFGLYNGELLLADEVLTPDSSRFWPADQYRVGQDPPSLDKQFLRDYLESVHWDKQPPPPWLPDEIVARTRERYEDAYCRLTGDGLPY